MYSNGKKTIGVFVTQVHQEFQETLSKGICKQAKERDYNVAFFSNFLGYGEFLYEAGEKDMADLPSYEDLDGIIIVPDTMYVHGFEKRIRENIKKYAKCPVVSVRQKIDEYYNVLLEDYKALDDIIRHFIVDHQYKRINFLTGPKDNPVSLERLESYRRIMQEHGLTYEEEQIYYGDFWKFSGYDAVNYWLEDSKKWPEAIICANDYMAITVCNALADKGLTVPYDIAVSGCDNIELAEDFTPTITTVGMPIYEMGVEAVDKIYRFNQGITQDPISYLKSVTYFRESCGCEYMKNNRSVELRRNRIIEEIEAKDKAITNNAYMSIDLTGVTKQDVLYNKLSSYTYLNEGFSAFYMCLYKNWDVYQGFHEVEEEDTDKIVMEVGIKDGEWLQKVEFEKRDLLPPAYMDQTPQFFYFNMLHHQEKCFGYTAISFYHNYTYKSSYQGWVINVSNALENVRIHGEMNRLLYTLEDMYVKDELTGLYNRRGLQIFGQKYLDQCKEKKCKFMIFSADMDNLKYINDNFGHASGDIAIKEVADALLFAADDDEICIRMGGDEFAVIGLEYDEDKINYFINNIENHIHRFNQEQNYGFTVKVSYGYSLLMPNEYTQFEDCLGIADTKMYQQKYEKAAIRLKQQDEANNNNERH
ncbi:GGDEF domain-containing protein [Mobilitalea sibirica]|uniref:GGDEF domain-containing protein n=1 Tax=Mobilitalea sibirica TaxID=1462919 RepID=A0A8J7H437_9FIRM|nr:GGDEF domain-containing protein [Mobilitalea sibirica]MBH1941925.1 GGDEF domain-containing protein [Mobilitalea sibirica]